ncbi:endonuclease/exonuclease/phosphatase family protein [Geodermatophilus chilensis]|uniref:endonuclease/exonuclease/phosphatase family protein n=1 Tax=Geodermatophilus chilensis TaxID=2035835 RepID=UPI0012FFF2B9|nr:endonuclease/exonuclease/phosphatase family protein [Geodermatophilus chilensis]
MSLTDAKVSAATARRPTSTVRIGIWNLKLCPTSTSERGQAIAAWMDAQGVDVWLLTEVHRDWGSRGTSFVVSPPRGIDKEKRWAGIETAVPLGELHTAGGAEHAGEEGLVLARLALGESSVLVVCSVLPWRGAGDYWPGLPSGQAAQFRYVLDHHVARIEAERLPGEPLIWGGDFNQRLTAPFRGCDRRRRESAALGVQQVRTRGPDRTGAAPQ